MWLKKKKRKEDKERGRESRRWRWRAAGRGARPRLVPRRPEGPGPRGHHSTNRSSHFVFCVSYLLTYIYIFIYFSRLEGVTYSNGSRVSTGVVSTGYKCVSESPFGPRRGWLSRRHARPRSWGASGRVCGSVSFLPRNGSPQSRGSCFIRMTEGPRGVRRSSRRSTYSLNWDESTPPPQEPTTSKPRCCSRSRTCTELRWQ